MKIQKISLLALPLLIASCSSSKMVPEGEYILNKVEVKSDSAGYNAGALKQYVRQKEKPKLFSLFKNPFSKKPVIYDTLQARLSCQDLLTAMQNQGFMHAGVSLYTTKKGKKLDATYLLHPGEPFVIGKVKYEVEDEHIQQLLHLDNPDNQQIKPGMRFTVETLDNERRRISSLLTNDGYFRFHKDFIQFSADTIAGQKDIALTLHLMKYKANSNAPEVDHPRYEIRNINYLSNDSDRIHLRHQVLLNATALREGRPYSAAALQRTYNNFARLQAVKYTNISFSEVPDSNQVTENGMERDSISRQMDCNIQISTNKPSTIAFQPEGTNTAGDLGAAASLTYTNRNFVELTRLLPVWRGIRTRTILNIRLKANWFSLVSWRLSFQEISEEDRRQTASCRQVGIFRTVRSFIAAYSLLPGVIAGQNRAITWPGVSTCSISTMCICHGYPRLSRETISIMQKTEMPSSATITKTCLS